MVKARVGFQKKFGGESLPIDDLVSVENHIITGLKGIPDFCVRVYQPKIRTEKLSGLLWIHGGGYIVDFPERKSVKA